LQPNVVVVLADQLRAFEVGCYGNLSVRTPNIDRLAAEGVRFDVAVTNNPVCTPARSCLLTGQYSRTCTGELGNVADDPPCPRRRRLVDPTMAEVLRDAGYRTGLVGKWHIDPSPMILGFDSALYPLTVHRYSQQTYIENDDRWFTVGAFSPDFEADAACRFVAENKDRPFFLYYNIPVPHNPIGPGELPERFANMFDPTSVPLRPNVWQDGRMAGDDTWFKVMRSWDYFWRMWGPCWNAAPSCGYPDAVGELPVDALPENYSLPDLAALYYGATSWADTLLGRVIGAIEENGLADNTLIVFLSDHGDNLGSHHLFNKDCLYEEAIRIPFILRRPGALAPIVNSEQIAQIIDVAPTLLAMCGLEVPESMQGRDLSDVVRGHSDAMSDNFAFIETDPSQFGQPTIGIRSPEMLYGMTLSTDCRTIDDDHAFLFNLKADPYQQSNLADAVGSDPIRAELKERLATWHQSTPWLIPGN